MNYNELKLYTETTNAISFRGGTFCVYTLLENNNMDILFKKGKLDGIEYYVPMKLNSFGINYVPDLDDFVKMDPRLKLKMTPDSLYNDNHSFIYDMDPYFDALKDKYQYDSNNILRLFESILTTKPEKLKSTYKKVFIYYVDLYTQFENDIEKRKLALVLNYIKKHNTFPVDYGYIAIVLKNETRFIKFYDKLASRQISKVLMTLYRWNKNLRYGQTFKDISSSNKVDDFYYLYMYTIQTDILLNDSELKTMWNVILNYTNKNKEDYIQSMKVIKQHKDNKELISSFLLRMIRFYTMGNSKDYYTIDKDKKYSDKIELIKELIQQIITPKININKTEKLIMRHHIKAFDVTTAVVNDDLDSSKIIEKNKKEFETVTEDMKSVVQTSLSNKMYKMNVVDIKYDKEIVEDNYIDVTEKQQLKINLKDENGKRHTIKINIPKMNSDGTFTVNGIPRRILNEVVLKPITVTKPYVCRIQTLNSIIMMETKNIKSNPFWEMYFMGVKIPLIQFLCLFNDVKDVFEKFNINYEITEKKIPDKPFIKLKGKERIILTNIDDRFKTIFLNTIIKYKYNSYTSTEFFNNKTFESLVIEKTKNRRIVLLIKKQIREVLDYITLSLLKQENLPTDLFNLFHYCADLIKDGTFTNRIDFKNLRIRNTEVFSQLLNFEINKAYVEYQAQLISGNKAATLKIDPDKFFSKIIQLSNFVISEQINPLEELSMKNKITHVGIGAIPKKEAVSDNIRTLHPTGIGVMDPNDTPESSSVGILNTLTLGADISTSRGTINLSDDYKTKPASVMSPSMAIVPFANHNESARLILSGNQTKQALNIKGKEPPMLQTGFENVLAKNLSDNFVKKSPEDGKIIKVTDSKIVIQTKTGSKTIDITSKLLKGGGGLDSESVFTPKVKVGDKVKKDEIIAEGACISEGQLALGKNLLAGYMQYAGWTFEDGIIISEKIVGDYTSTHVDTIDIIVSEGSEILDIVKINQKLNIGDNLISFVPADIKDTLSYSEDIILKNYILLKNKYNNAVIKDILIYPNDDLSKYPKINKAFHSSPGSKKINKKSFGKFVYENEVFEGIYIRFKISYDSNLAIGDKFTGRYGNKGIICKILKEKEMPVTPWGEHLDIILNPFGVIGRMNIGQLMELGATQICKKLSDLIQTQTKQNYINTIKKVYGILDKTKGKKIMNDLVQYLTKMNKKQYEEFKEKIKKFKLSIIVPPFKSPKYSDIKNALKVLKLSPKYKLKLPEYDNAETNSYIPVGYIYMLKLEHLAEKKVSARATHTYSQKTGQPYGGKKRQGGQRLGELEVHALVAFSAHNVVREFFSSSSDDVQTKQEMLNNIIENGYANFTEVKTTRTKDLISSYFNTLLLDF